MRRRHFLGFLGTAAAVAGGYGIYRQTAVDKLVSPATPPVSATSQGITALQTVSAIKEDIPTSSRAMMTAIERLSGPAPNSRRYMEEFQTVPDPSTQNEEVLAKYLSKMVNFEESHEEDVYLPQQQYALLTESFKRIDRVQTLVGHGNFNVLGFDDMLRYASYHASVGAFPKAELEFLESLFFDDVARYGFYGEKVIDSLTAVVNKRDRTKVSRTGHFLFKGKPEETYEKIRKDVGDSIVLTSGIRGIMKQTHLFLAKTIQSEGNLSLASRSLAPPGHSFHGVGDFDVGKVGYGAKNFTQEFSRTEEFQRLVDLGYLDIRYTEKNLLGVRYEPWHIKVA